MTSENRTDMIFRVLKNPERRKWLIRLVNNDEVELDGESQIQWHHCHGPILEESGLAEYNSGTLTKGENWEEVEGILTEVIKTMRVPS